MKISHICDNGNYEYIRNYIPDAVCVFVSDNEFSSLLSELGYEGYDGYEIVEADGDGFKEDSVLDNDVLNKLEDSDKPSNSTLLPSYSIFPVNANNTENSNSTGNSNNTRTITTLEIAEMMGVEHSEILKKLQGTFKSDGSVKQVGIIPVLTKGNFSISDYFIPSTYKDAYGKENKCYFVTKLGCDFLANKFTGEKGILFTAKYVKRFDEMEQELKYKIPQTYREALLETVRLLDVNEKQQREIEQKNLEIYQKNNEISHKSDVIDGFSNNISLADKRQIINRIIRYQGGNYDRRWRILYREFNNKFHINIYQQIKLYNERVEENKRYKRKVDYIDKHLNQIDDLYNIAVKVFESDCNMLAQELYHINNSTVRR